jgi:hypothetical protein
VTAFSLTIRSCTQPSTIIIPFTTLRRSRHGKVIEICPVILQVSLIAFDPSCLADRVLGNLFGNLSSAHPDHQSLAAAHVHEDPRHPVRQRSVSMRLPLTYVADLYASFPDVSHAQPSQEPNVEECRGSLCRDSTADVPDDAYTFVRGVSVIRQQIHQVLRGVAQVQASPIRAYVSLLLTSTCRA